MLDVEQHSTFLWFFISSMCKFSIKCDNFELLEEEESKVKLQQKLSAACLKHDLADDFHVVSLQYKITQRSRIRLPGLAPRLRQTTLPVEEMEQVIGFMYLRKPQ